MSDNLEQRCYGCMQLYNGDTKVCPYCGYDQTAGAVTAIHLEPGTILHGRYLIGRVLGFGGFGATYIAWDQSLEQKVAIREYLPGEFSTRIPGQSAVTVFRGEKEEQFAAGLEKFIEETRRLAKFQSEEGIVTVFDAFRENGTAYLVMEFLEGETLASYLEREGLIAEDQAIALLLPVMKSLQVVHKAGILHRDIAPDNIFLTNDGKAKLIDFGASRYATTSHSRSLTVVIKSGYSPEEQYRSRGDQGDYTDVYSIAATLYKIITGKTPPDAMERRAMYEAKNRDLLVPPHRLNKEISLNRENAILNAMNVRIEDRTPTVEEFIKELESETEVKRRGGTIKKIDLLSWPLWARIVLPAVLALLVVFGILLATGVIDFNRFSQDIVIPEGVVEVPEVEGLVMVDAVDRVESGMLLVSTKGNVQSDYISAGTILLQTPMGASYSDIGTMVELTVSSGGEVLGPVDGISTVPYVIWDTLKDAKKKLKKAGLSKPLIQEEYNNNVSAGSVISQDPDAGAKVPEGSSITLVISKGPEPFAMPDVTGMSRSDAVQALAAVGLSVTLEYETNREVAEDTVLRQETKAGALVQYGDSVILVLATRRVIISVPSVVGMDQAAARTLLESGGFRVVVLENYSDTVAAGNVISQTPAAGSSQPQGSEITIYVSRGREDTGQETTVQAPETTVSSEPTTAPEATEPEETAAPPETMAPPETTAPPETRSPERETTTQKPDPKTFTVSLDAQGGIVSPGSISVSEGENYGNLPDAAREGYTFAGWFSTASGGSQAKSGSALLRQSDHTLFARWKINRYTLYLDANGGSLSETSRLLNYGDEYGTLPEPVLDYYTFAGWWTKPSGGKQVGAAFEMGASDTSIFAHWEENAVLTVDETGFSTYSDGKVVAEYWDMSSASWAIWVEIPADIADNLNMSSWSSKKNKSGDKIQYTSIYRSAAELPFVDGGRYYGSDMDAYRQELNEYVAAYSDEIVADDRGTPISYNYSVICSDGVKYYEVIPK